MRLGVLPNVQFQCRADPLSRVDFGSRERQKEFFRKARDFAGSWKDLYVQVSKMGSSTISRRKLKRWKLAHAMPTTDAIVAICRFTGDEFRTLGLTFKERSWGQRKGGNSKVASYGCNLTLQDRMIGGKLTGRSNSIDHLKAVGLIGAARAAKSPKNPNRQVLSRGGVRFCNQLEKDTMDELVRQGMRVEYEPVIHLGTRWIFPDFRVDTTYIECTEHSKVNEKGPALRERFQLLKTHVPFAKGIVVTTPELVLRYRRYLRFETEVVTVRDLRRVMKD